MKMAGVLVVFARLAAETKLCLTRLWVQLTARRLCECSPADVAADPNDRLKLVTVQGEWGGELEVGGVSAVLCVCALENIAAAWSLIVNVCLVPSIAGVAI